MATLIFKLLLLCVLFTIPYASRRTIRDVYQPYGPQMCANLAEELNDTFAFVAENLTCRLGSSDDSESRKLPSLSTCPNDEMRTNNFTMFDLPTGQNIYDSYIKDGILAYPSPHLNTESKPSRDVQSVKSRCNILLHQACEKGELCMVKYILAHKLTDMNCRSKLGRTPVMSASGQGQVEIFHFLVDQGCDLSTIDGNNNTVLHVACMGGNIDIVREIMVNTKDIVEIKERQGRTPVLISAYFGHKAVLDFFVGEDCNLTVVDNDGNNILHLACLNGKVDVVKYILSKQIIDTESRNSNGRTPVMSASQGGYVAIVKLLMRKGCNMRVVDDYKDTVLHAACCGGKTEMVNYILCEQIIDIDSRDRYGTTPVMEASRNGHVAIVKLLMRKGCNMSLVDDHKKTVLHSVCFNGKTEMVKYILSKQIIDIESRDRYGRTPVMVASQGGYVAIVKLLVSNGCNMKVVDDYKETILHAVCFYGKTEMVKYILSKQFIDIESRGVDGMTPVMKASWAGHVAIVQLLMSKGCDLAVADDFKNNILHLACVRGHVKMVKYILSRKIIDINSREKNGRTPVMRAAEKGHIRIVKCLTNSGCNLGALDHNGNNILHVVCEYGYVDIVKYLIKLGLPDRNRRNRNGRTPLQTAMSNDQTKVVHLLKMKM